jgi:hypothetical protein
MTMGVDTGTAKAVSTIKVTPLVDFNYLLKLSFWAGLPDPASLISEPVLRHRNTAGL